MSEDIPTSSVNVTQTAAAAKEKNRFSLISKDESLL
jgi:hypothetical protein